MNTSHKLALIVAYYLSRFDRDAWKNLGYASFSDAVKNVGRILGVKSTTVKNMRDEFDPYHENVRAGWHQRQLSGSRRRTMQALQDLDQYALYEIVEEILKNTTFRESAESEDLLSIFSEKSDAVVRGDIFTLRGRTGLRAEEYFMEHFSKLSEPYSGSLVDRRQDGIGYDFEIKGVSSTYFIEVKGLSRDVGGILFTDKEWATAKTKKEKYILALVVELGKEPEIFFIEDPASIFSPMKNIYPAIRIDWPVPSKAIEAYLRSVRR